MIKVEITYIIQRSSSEYEAWTDYYSNIESYDAAKKKLLELRDWNDLNNTDWDYQIVKLISLVEILED